MDAVTELLDHISQTLPQDRAALRHLKTAVAARTGGRMIRNDALIARYRADVVEGIRLRDERVEQILTLNGIRSESGIATVTVITEPYACPGRCVYCPTEARAPKSYLTNEPAVMRALRHDYDPYEQVRARLSALDETGHPTDKIELIIKGGTWSFYPAAYQETFIRRCFDAANDFTESSRLKTLAGGTAGVPFVRPESLRDSRRPRTDEGSAVTGPAIVEPSALIEAQRVNETAANRIIGITIETRPDYIDDAELHRLRELGVTRVELGIQTLDEEILSLIVRDHGTAEVRSATRLLKDAGLKVAYHLMPNLPGATPANDLLTARRLFEEEAYRPDTMKIYPCVVIESAELFDWWKAGRYTPYDDETLIELLIQIKQLVPPYVRIERVIRDIPSTSIQAGSLTTNLREVVQERMRSRGLRCRCIRCRQVRRDTPGPFELVRRTYQASDGTEVFLSIEDPRRDELASLLRLRIPSHQASPWSVLQSAALIRELHSYGAHLPLRQHRAGAIQHHGFGHWLMEEAERIAREEFGMSRIAVIAGVGVREYYRRLGYTLHDTYMLKHLGSDPS